MNYWYTIKAVRQDTNPPYIWFRTQKGPPSRSQTLSVSAIVLVGSTILTLEALLDVDERNDCQKCLKLVLENTITRLTTSIMRSSQASSPKARSSLFKPSAPNSGGRSTTATIASFGSWHLMKLSVELDSQYPLGKALLAWTFWERERQERLIRCFGFTTLMDLRKFYRDVQMRKPQYHFSNDPSDVDCHYEQWPTLPFA